MMLFLSVQEPREVAICQICPAGQKATPAYMSASNGWPGSFSDMLKRSAKRVLVLGGGNTAMDCCRTARRLGGEDVKVVVRSPQAEMKASDWEIEDALKEDIPILDNHVPLEFVIEDGKLTGMRFEKVKPRYDDNGRRKLLPTGEDPVFLPCDEVLLAIGQLNAYPFIEPETGITFNDKGLPVLDPVTLQSSVPSIFFGGDSAFGPGNIIIAVAHGHEAAISIDLLCQGKDPRQRPEPHVTLAGQKLGFHDWIYDSHVTEDERQIVPTVEKAKTLRDRLIEVELGFPVKTRQDGGKTLPELRCTDRFRFRTLH